MSGNDKWSLDKDGTAVGKLVAEQGWDILRTILAHWYQAKRSLCYTYHVEAAVEIDSQLEVIAMALMLAIPLVPEIADRGALKAAVDDECGAVGDQPTDQSQSA